MKAKYGLFPLVLVVLFVFFLITDRPNEKSAALFWLFIMVAICLLLRLRTGGVFNRLVFGRPVYNLLIAIRRNEIREINLEIESFVRQVIEGHKILTASGYLIPGQHKKLPQKEYTFWIYENLENLVLISQKDTVLHLHGNNGRILELKYNFWGLHVVNLPRNICGKGELVLEAL